MLKNSYGILIVSTLLSMLGILGMDIYIPALPSITTYFHTSNAWVKLTLTAYALGIATSPLIMGPMADRFGRRPLIMLCSLTGLCGTLLAILSPNIGTLIMVRFIQGAGLGAITALNRTISRDLFQGKKLAQVASLLSIGFVMAPAVAPLIGGYLQFHFGWQSIFMVLAGLIMTLLSLVYWLVPETAKHLRPQATQPQQIIKNYKQLLSNPIFTRFIICSSTTMAGIISFFTLSPFIMQQQYHLNAAQYGWFVCSITFMMILSRVINFTIIRYFRIEQCMIIGLSVMIMASLSLLLLNLTLQHHWAWAIMLPMNFYVLSTGIIFPNASAGALTPFKDMAGSAGALYGCLQMSGSVAATLIATFIQDTVLSLATLLLLISSSALIGFLWFLRFPSYQYRVQYG